MTRAQGYEIIGIAWLALAAFDKPIDWGSLIYLCAAIWAFWSAFDSWDAQISDEKDRTHDE